MNEFTSNSECLQRIFLKETKTIAAECKRLVQVLNDCGGKKIKWNQLCLTKYPTSFKNDTF